MTIAVRTLSESSQTGNKIGTRANPLKIEIFGALNYPSPADKVAVFAVAERLCETETKGE